MLIRSRKMDALNAYFSSDKLKIIQQSNPFVRLNDAVYSIIEQGIRAGQLPPGTRLSVTRIAELLEVSRTPVSDALEQLKANGLVFCSAENPSRYFVFDISYTTLDHLFTARRAIESTAAYLCAQHCTTIDLKKLKSLADGFRKTFETHDFTNFGELDKDFHRMIIHSCKNPYLIKMYSQMERFIDYYSIRSREYMLSLDSDPAFSVLSLQHGAICNAIMLGLPDVAERASSTHLETCYNLSMRYHTFTGKLGK